MTSFDPTPDIDGMPESRLSVPDVHCAHGITIGRACLECGETDVRTDPVPDTGGYPDHRFAVPDEHTALRLLRRGVTVRFRCGAIHPGGDRTCTAYPWHVLWDGQGIDTSPHVFYEMGWPIEWTDDVEGATPAPWSAAELDLLHRLTQQENPT